MSWGNTDNWIEVRTPRQRAKFALLSLLCQVQRVKFGDSKRWNIKGWLDCKTKKVYITWIRKSHD